MMIVITSLFVVMATGIALAATEPQGAENTDLVDEGTYDFGTNGTADVTDGHVYYSDLNTNMSSIKWAGLYGNVSGNIVLSDDDQDVLFNWAANGRLVYATTAAHPDWSSVSDADESAVLSDFSHLDTPDADNYSATFTGEIEDIDSALYDTVESDYAITYDSSETGIWKTYSLQDAANNIVFAGRVHEGGNESYKGTTVDYQMILPEDGTGGDDTATTYTLFAELQ
ncbi:MAG: hypothetical protein ACLFSN_01545 [Candidatus Woesearchaeota archaeon]